METTGATVQYCKSCGISATGNFCSNCGQSYGVKRITLKGLLHDAFHFFTHLEKGFGYTVKRLVTAPGTMQREYIEGDRNRYQKPFSLFFICASVNAVARYWIEELLIKYSDRGVMAEARLHHEYQLLLLVALVPVAIFFMWLLFANSKYNYAETGVQQLYMFSFILLVTIVIGCLRFIWKMDTAYVEFPLFIGYSIITNLRFYKTLNRWRVVVKTILLAVLFFWAMQVMEDFVVEWIKAKG
jgi:hypothetical protein